MKLTKAEYKKLADSQSTKSKTVKNTVMAFIVGGAICVLGQVISNYAGSAFGLDDKGKSAVTAISLIFLTALLTGFKVFDNIAKHAGAGTFVPITGFANSVVSPAMEFKSEGFVLGMAAKMFVVAGPVLVFGTVASIIYGLILVAFKLV